MKMNVLLCCGCLAALVHPLRGQATSPVTASSEQVEQGNLAVNAVDGDSKTRWAAAGPTSNEWLQYDLGREAKIGVIEIEWFKTAAYPYVVEVSSDAKAWRVVEDRKGNATAIANSRVAANCFARYVRVTVPVSLADRWASIRELKVLSAAGKVIEPAKP